MVRAAHLQLNKDESIEDVLQKLECTSSAPEKPSKATPGKKLFASRGSGDRTRKRGLKSTFDITTIK